MVALQKFNDLFNELQADADKLQKRRDALETECRTLEAKKTFADNSLAELKQQLQAVKDRITDVNTEKQRMIDTLNTEYDRLKVDVASLEAKRSRIQSTLETMQQASDQAVIEHDGVLQAKKAEIRQAEAELEAKRDESVHVDDIIEGLKLETADLEAARADKQATLDTLAVTSEKAVRDEQQKLYAVQEKIVDTDHELEVLTAKLADKQQEYIAADKKHADYLEYEQRANKALDAREQSLHEKEAELNERQLRLTRRSGVLDNL